MKRLLILFLLILSACNSVPDKLGYIKKSDVEGEIKKLKIEHNVYLEQKEKEIRDVLGKIIDAKNTQIQKASNSNYGAYAGFNSYKNPSRIDIIIHNRVIEVGAALGVGPTLDAIKEENARLKTELDENLTTLEQLKKTSDDKVKENEALVLATKRIEDDMKRIEDEKKQINADFLLKLQEKQDQLNDANNKVIAKEHERGESKEYIENNKKRISIVSGIISTLCLLGAVFSPIFKDKFGILSAIFGAISIGIIFLEPIHIAISFAVVLVICVVWAVRHFHVLDKTSTNLVGFIQHVKDTKPDLYKEELKDGLEEFNSIYKKVNGKIEKIKDTSVINLIDQKLMQQQKK